MKNRAENRRIRAQLKAEQNREKNIRLAEGISLPAKAIHVNWDPELTKSPRLPIPVDNYKNTFFSWCITHADREGNWSWNEPRDWNDSEYSLDIEGHLENLVNNTWYEIETLTYNGAGGYRKKLNKSQPLDSICLEAQERWMSNPDLAQFEEIFRFRTGSKKRIWGVRVVDHFFTVWYERNHKICPAQNEN